MHELSIASAILESARRHTPAGAVLTSVRIVAGPMRSIEPQAMRFAWESVIANTNLDDVILDLKELPWRLRCPDCGNEWNSDDLRCACSCGCAQAFPVGGDELRIDAIEVDDQRNGDSHEYLGCGKCSEAQR